jgi:hypothetical protein
MLAMTHGIFSLIIDKRWRSEGAAVGRTDRGEGGESAGRTAVPTGSGSGGLMQAFLD